MGIIWVSILVGLLGALGGFTNCLLTGEFRLPHIDAETRVWRPGWIGTVMVGAIAAILIWGLYGPCSSVDITKGGFKDVSLTIAQLFSSVGVGIGGGRILMDLAGKQADRVAREFLARSMKDFVER